MQRMLQHRVWLAVLLALATVNCGLVSRDEVARVPSPDHRAEAVVIETNGGATTSFGYEVRVLERGSFRGVEVAWLSGAVRNENASGVNLTWVSDTELHIEYLEARDKQLEKSNVRVAGRDIRIVLRPGIRDLAAPSGGMLYNVERKGKKPV